MANIMICNLQKIVLYETKARFYVIGSNNTEDIFRVLKIDRTEPCDLHISDDKLEYSRSEVQNLLRTLEVGNRPKQQGQKGTAGLARTVSAFGILGFVSFLEGHYIILITKRRRVAVIGGHTIYKIEDSSMVYIPNDACVAAKVPHPDEARYVRNFQNVDLSSNFYFSYSYDLTNTLQHNLTPVIGVPSGTKEPHGPQVYRPQPMMKFVWNAFLWSHACKNVHPDWVTYIIHGFIGQANVCTFGRSIYIALIARRSNQFAGTRFLKRGANSEGYVANEVETEQIVHDASLTHFKRGHYTSFVQVRGSVPGMWSQDISNMVPKPPINLDMADPYARLAGGHFNQLLGRYGSPVIVINLVKKREKRKREAILSEELESAIKYLNQFLPPRHSIRYIELDMARFTKNPKLNVINRLDAIADMVVKQTGLFLSGPHIEPSLPVRPQARCVYPNADDCFTFIKQMGTARTNCVDCLDRTNTAQFVIGKYALGHQLFCLGVVDSTTLKFDTDAVRMLEDLYEDMGDTLALQYGGSQLVHSIRTYRKVSPWTSHSRDIKQTLSRYYSNTFSDADKQSALNLFLGVFRPHLKGPSLWDLPTDYYLHHSEAAGQIINRPSYTQWFDIRNIQSLPLPFNELEKSLSQQDQSAILQSTPPAECIDPYFDYYRPAELTSLQELFCSNMPHSVSTDQKAAARVTAERLVTAGSPKTSSDLPSSSEGTSSTDEELSEPRSVANIGGKSRKQEIYMEDLFPTTKEVYGVAIQNPERQDISIYQRFVSVDLNSRSSCPDVHSVSGRVKRCMKRATRLIPNSVFSLDSSYEVTPPTLSRSSRAIYEAFVLKGMVGAQPVFCKDQDIYRKFVKYKSM
ncbi:polyphosphoinositide phosphatase-like isoform X2 [Acanthaster planci]|uniref:Polyphosphoinositide phosphatase-like isoform X2 n=1 Tax=Acanthaster planci TaxID=133434 RepID=A0A8B7ZFN7_ACAPL|nr:polyphosphoinositide phosphatase-like isoform X2 [Acanthaster planci]